MTVNLEAVLTKFEEATHKFEKEQGPERLDTLKKVEKAAIPALIGVGIIFSAFAATAIIYSTITPMVVIGGTTALGLVALLVVNYATNYLFSNYRSYTDLKEILTYYRNDADNLKEEGSKTAKMIKHTCEDSLDNLPNESNMTLRARSLFDRRLRLMYFLETNPKDLSEVFRVLKENLRTP